MTSGVDMVLYCIRMHHQGREQKKHRINISDHLRYKKVSHLRNEMLASSVDAVVLLHDIKINYVPPWRKGQAVRHWHTGVAGPGRGLPFYQAHRPSWSSTVYD
jgi:hypothetical protein